MNSPMLRVLPPAALSPKMIKSRLPLLFGPKTSLESRLMTAPVRA